MAILSTNTAINALIQYRTFTSEEHKLANTLRMSDADAQQELLCEALNHRLRGYTDEQLLSAVLSDNQVMSFKLIYARRDILRNHYKAQRRQQEVAHALQMSIDLDPKARTRQDVKEALPLVPDLFTNKATRGFVQLVLNQGQAAAMQLLGLDRRQFMAKVRRAERYCQDHRQKIIGLIKGRKDEQMITERDMLQTLHDLLADDGTTDSDIAIWVDEHKDYCEDACGLAVGIHNQRELLIDFENAQRRDQYRLINWMECRLEELNRKLVNA